MSCYTRHLGSLLERMELPDTKESRKLLDSKIRVALDLQEQNCPEIWQKVKAILEDERKVSELLSKIDNIRK